MKIQSRLAEAEGAVQNLNRKAVALEKEKMKLQADIENMVINVEDFQINNYTPWPFCTILTLKLNPAPTYIIIQSHTKSLRLKKARPNFFWLYMDRNQKGAPL